MSVYIIADIDIKDQASYTEYQKLVPAIIENFDYKLLSDDFENALLIRKLDAKKFSVFGFLFAETSPGNEEELDSILVSDLRKYIIASQ